MEGKKLIEDDIIKSLEDCSKGDCKGCYYEKYADSVGFGYCLLKRLGEAVDIIHSLQLKAQSQITAKEILAMFDDRNYITEKELKNAIAERYGVKNFKAKEELEKEELEKELAEHKEFTEKAKAEIERLTEDNDKQKAVIERLKIDREQEKKWCKIKIKQVVEDTAEEALEQFICKIVNENLVYIKDDLYDELLLAKDELLKEKYGVE